MCWNKWESCPLLNNRHSRFSQFEEGTPTVITTSKKFFTFSFLASLHSNICYLCFPLEEFIKIGFPFNNIFYTILQIKFINIEVQPDIELVLGVFAMQTSENFANFDKTDPFLMVFLLKVGPMLMHFCVQKGPIRAAPPCMSCECEVSPPLPEFLSSPWSNIIHSHHIHQKV